MNDPGAMTVSVIMPAYNSASYIAEAIESVLVQRFPGVEVIVVDDGSVDETLAIAARYGMPVRCFQQRNQGAARARNFAVSQSQAEWLAFLDADDIWVPEKLTRQMAAMGNHVWSHTDNTLFGPDYHDTRLSSQLARKYDGWILEKLLVSNTIGTSSVIMKREVFNELGGFDCRLKALEDWELWLKVAARYPIAYVDQPLDHYRVHPASTTQDYRKTMHYHLALIERVFAPGGVGCTMPELKPAALASSYGVNSYIAEAGSDFTFAVRCALRALVHEPRNIARWRRLAAVLLASAKRANVLRLTVPKK
jgi:glycosyltransferase involved in cell wall biosynthesis